MSFALLIIGIVLLVSAIRNTQAGLVAVLRSDFTGPNNFTYWVIALIVIGAIGYVDKLKPLSDGLLVLIIVALFLSKGGFFNQFQSALKTTTGKTGLNLNLPGWAQPLPGTCVGPGCPQGPPVVSAPM